MPDSRFPPEFDAFLTMISEMYRIMSCTALGPDDPMPVSPNQKRAIVFLKRNPGSTLKDLAADLDMNLGSASDLVDRLVQIELIERRTNPDDRRQVQLSLTPAAMEKVKQMRAQRMTELEFVRDQMTTAQWEAFVQGMHIWTAHMTDLYPRRHALTSGE
jgi:DNA-binding MarR family transcriptional regulator